MIHKSYKVELDPNNKQITMFKQHSGCSRFVWNWALALLENDYKNGTNKLKPKRIDLIKLFNSIKREKFPWIYKCSSYVPTFALDHLFKCPQCESQIDRDFNSSINLKQYTAGSAEIYAGGDERSVGKKFFPTLLVNET